MAATSKTEKVIFAEEPATVHILDGDVVENEDGSLYEPHYSKVLLPGETIGLDEVPSYLRKLVEEGKAPGLSLLTPTQAKRLVKKAESAKVSVSDLVEIEADDE